MMVMAVWLTACARESYQPVPLDTQALPAAYASRNFASTELKDFLRQQGVAVTVFPLSHWPREALAAAAIYFRPEIAEARAQAAVAEAQVQHAGARFNPQIDPALEHHSKTDNGVTPWSIGAALSWLAERPGKRRARIAQAEAELVSARIAQSAASWRIRQQVSEKMLALFDARSQLHWLDAQLALNADEVQLLERRAEFGEANGFEINTRKLEAQRTALTRAAQEIVRQQAEAELAGILAVPVAALPEINTDYFATPASGMTSFNAAGMQAQALQQRADIASRLQAYVIAETVLNVEIEKQYPDITLSPGYLFDQADNVWRIAGQLVLPLLDQNQSAIAVAKAQRALRAREFESLQSQVLGELQVAHTALYAAAALQQPAQDLITQQLQQEKNLQRQIELLENDRLVLLRAQRETLDARQSAHALHIKYWQARLQLENVIQGYLP